MVEHPSNPYLEQEVLSASPAKLRWLLLRKGVNLCQVISELWRSGEKPIADQWSLRLRDILTELLGGIHGSDPVAQNVADLYVFMIQLLTQAEQARSQKQLAQLQELFEIEAETWLLVQRKLSAAPPKPKLSSPVVVASPSTPAASPGSLSLEV